MTNTPTKPAACGHRSDRIPDLVCVRKAGHDGSHTWDQASADVWDDEPQADTPTPEGRWTVDGDELVWDGKHRLWGDGVGALPHADFPDWFQGKSWDALVELVRRDGTAPTPEAVHEWLFESQLVEDATEMVWDGDDPDEVARIADVLAAVRALRDGAAR